jgi:hypothetical protein
MRNALRIEGVVASVPRPNCRPLLPGNRGVHTVRVSVAPHHLVCEASGVNRHRSCDHKVARSRARFTAALRGSARSVVNAGSRADLCGVSRCKSGQPSKSASHRRDPSFKAGNEEPVGAKNPCQFLQALARGSLTTALSARVRRRHFNSSVGVRGRSTRALADLTL